MNTAFFLRTRTIQLDIFGEGIMVQNQVDFTNFEKDDVPYGLHYACASTIGTLSIPRVILWARHMCV